MIIIVIKLINKLMLFNMIKYNFIKEKHTRSYYENVAHFHTIATARESFKSDQDGQHIARTQKS